METADGLKIKFDQVDYLPPEQRLDTCRLIWREIGVIEKAACTDPNFGLAEIRRIRELVPHVRSRISMLEAGLKRKKKAH